MTQVGIDIDSVVREVLRRLRALPSTGPSPKNQKNAPIPSQQIPSQQIPSQQIPGQQIAIDTRVITLNCLAAGTAGATRLLVRHDAIITPAVFDLLRDRGVTIERRDRPRSTTVLPKLDVFVMQDRIAALPRSIAGGLQVPAEVTTVTTQEQAIELAIETVDEGRLAAIVAVRPAAVVCAANRIPRIRAACGWDQAATRDAIEHLDANLLVVDRQRHGLNELNAILRTFARAARTNN